MKWIVIPEALIEFQNWHMRSESDRMSQGDYTQIILCNFTVPAMYVGMHIRLTYSSRNKYKT